MPTPDLSERRTSQIIQAAIIVFNKKGFHQARMEDIGCEAGLSKGTLYLYFKDKDTLIRAILDTVFSMETGDLQAALMGKGTAVEKLHAFVDLYLADGAEMEPMLPVIYEFFGMSLRHADVQAVLSEQFHLSVSIIEAIVQLGIMQGEIRPLNAQKIATTIVSLLDGTALQLAYGIPLSEANQLLRFGIDLLLGGALISNE